MSAVAIIGAGELGGALAHKLACRDQVDEIRLIDTAGGVAAGKALDIQQAGPVESFRVRLISAGEISAAAGAGVIVLADAAGTPSVEWQGEPGLQVLRQLSRLDEESIFVCAGASQRTLIEQAVRELRIPRGRLVGSAPGALASAVRAIIALETNGSPSDIALAVLGAPPDRAFIAWSAATLGGYEIGRVLTPPQIARVNARLPRLWPPGAYALSSAAARVCEAIAGGSRREFPCFVALDGELGARDRVAAVPVVLGPQGVERVAALSLSGQERVQLDNAIMRE